MKGSYARRTEITRDETRQLIKENRTDAHELKACEETIRACNAFLKSRGLYVGDSNMVTNYPVNAGTRKKEPARRKTQEPIQAKSLKAALLREIVMDARRRGVIKLAYGMQNTMPMSDLEDGNE